MLAKLKRKYMEVKAKEHGVEDNEKNINEPAFQLMLHH